MGSSFLCPTRGELLMAVTREYTYSDNDFDTIEVSQGGGIGTAYISPMDEGFYVTPKNSVALALNMLGHDRPVDEPVSTGRFEVGTQSAFLANSAEERNKMLDAAAALLLAVDATDRRQERLATAEKRRESAAASLARDVASIGALVSTGGAFNNDQIGKLREALGRYDAALAN